MLASPVHSTSPWLAEALAVALLARLDPSVAADRAVAAVTAVSPKHRVGRAGGIGRRGRARSSVLLDRDGRDDATGSRAAAHDRSRPAARRVAHHRHRPRAAVCGEPAVANSAIDHLLRARDEALSIRSRTVAASRDGVRCARDRAAVLSEIVAGDAGRGGCEKVGRRRQDERRGDCDPLRCLHHRPATPPIPRFEESPVRSAKSRSGFFERWSSRERLTRAGRPANTNRDERRPSEVFHAIDPRCRDPT